MDWGSIFGAGMSGGLTGLLGGITGVIGGVISAITNYKMQKLKNEHDIAMMDKNMEYLRVEADASVKIQQAKTESEIAVTELKVFNDSITGGNRQVFSQGYAEMLFNTTGWLGCITKPIGALVLLLLGFVEFLQTAIRPALTIYLIGATTWVTKMAWDNLERANKSLAMSTTEAVIIFKDVETVIIYLTISSVTWWFADRGTAKYLQGVNIGKKK